MKNKLPDGWKEVELKDICVKITDGTHKTPKYIGEGIPFISTNNLDPTKPGFNFSRYEKYISEDEHKELTKRCKPEKEDILISKCGTIGRTKLVDVDYEFSIFVGLALLKLDKSKIYGKYLEILLNSDAYFYIMCKLAPGSTRKTLTIGAIEKIPLPLPSLPTQQRIVSILEKAEQAKEMRKEADELTKEFLKAVFMEMFVGEKKFGRVRIEDVIIETENENPEREYPDKYFEYVDISSIDNKQGKIISSSKILGKEAPSRAKQKIKFNDLIISTVRPNLNSVAIVPKELDQQICSTGFCVLRADIKKVLPEYLYLISRSSLFIESMNKIAKGASYPAVSDADILNYEIPLPPIELQNKFTSIVKEVELMKEQQKHSKEQIGNLFNALMQKAFKGELII